MKMPKRSHVDEHYTAYLEGTLPESLRQQVEAHLSACPRCAAELAALRLLVADLRAMPRETPPVPLAAGVRARLAARQQPRPSFLRWPAFAGGVAVIAVLLLLICLRVIPRQQTRVAALPPSVRANAARESGMPVAQGNSAANAHPAPPMIIAKVDGAQAPARAATASPGRVPGEKTMPPPRVAAPAAPRRAGSNVAVHGTGAPASPPSPATEGNGYRAVKMAKAPVAVQPGAGATLSSHRIAGSPLFATVPKPSCNSIVTYSSDSVNGTEYAFSPATTLSANAALPAATPAAPAAAAGKDIRTAPPGALGHAKKPGPSEAGALTPAPGIAPALNSTASAQTAPPASVLCMNHNTGNISASAQTWACVTPAGNGRVTVEVRDGTAWQMTTPATVGQFSTAQNATSTITQCTLSAAGDRLQSSPAKMTAIPTVSQALSFGTVELGVNSQPVIGKTLSAIRSARRSEYVVQLRVSDTAPVQLTVHSLDPAQHAQQFTITATARTLSLPVPTTVSGAVLALTFHSGRHSATLYLLVPGSNPRRSLTAVTVHDRPAYQPLLHLANDAGIYLLCPSTLAEQKLSCTVTNTPPLAALHALLRQHQYQLTCAGLVGSITPGVTK